MSTVEKTQFGFTLAELLIALAILGVIATFTIPKILASQQSQKKQAVFKETIATLDTVLFAYCANPSAYNGQSDYAVFSSQINTVKLCPGNSETLGCSPASTLGETSQPGFILHNGATVAGFSAIVPTGDGIVVDWNGMDGPNIDGDDQIRLFLNFGPAAEMARPCSVGPFAVQTTSINLWSAIFQ